MGGEYEGRVVVVTGASRGIGRGCVDVFLRDGATVVGCSRGDDADRPGSERYDHRVVDVSVPAEIEGLIAWTLERHGRLDAIVNNAGTHPPTTAIDDVTVEEFDRLIDTNLKSVFVGCRAALPALRRTRGAIVNMGSAVGLYGQEGAATYCATKGAISGLTKALAIDEAPNGVRVNCVCPGAILTPLAEEVQPPERIAVIGSWSWMERWGTSDEVGELVAFLAGPRAAFITGQDLVIGGGAELGYGFKGREYYRTMGTAPVSPRPGEDDRGA